MGHNPPKSIAYRVSKGDIRGKSDGLIQISSGNNPVIASGSEFTETGSRGPAIKTAFVIVQLLDGASCDLLVAQW